MLSFDALVSAWEEACRAYLRDRVDPEEYTALPGSGASIQESKENIYYLSRVIYNLTRRLLDAQPRHMHYSSVFLKDDRRSLFEPKVSRILGFIGDGDPRINDPVEKIRSKTIETTICKRGNTVIAAPNGFPEIFQDYMLYEWNIYHFHIETPRGGNLLFVYVTPDDAYVIKIGSHKEFADPALIQLLEAEWPGLLPKLHGVSGNNLTPDEVGRLRRSHANTAVDTGNGAMANFDSLMSDGTPLNLLRTQDIVMDLLMRTTSDLQRQWRIITRFLGGEPACIIIETEIDCYSPIPARILLKRGVKNVELVRESHDNKC